MKLSAVKDEIRYARARRRNRQIMRPAIIEDRERGYSVRKTADMRGVTENFVRKVAGHVDMPEAGNGYVGKYDALYVWEREDGMRWSVHLGKWTNDPTEGTSFLDDEFEEFFSSLPAGGHPVDINEC
jgi:hypothetical protein